MLYKDDLCRCKALVSRLSQVAMPPPFTDVPRVLAKLLCWGWGTNPGVEKA